MEKIYDEIVEVNLSEIPAISFTKTFVGCIVLTHDNRILLQYRDESFFSHPDCIATFGGRLEENETPMQGLIRELREELGARVVEKDVVELAAITEKETEYKELIHTYFWHDKHSTISTCEEGSPMYFDNVASVQTAPNVMSDVKWLLGACLDKGLLTL